MIAVWRSAQEVLAIRRWSAGASLEQIRRGTWWILPFGRAGGEDEIIGQALTPGVPLDSCPVVYANGCEASVVCTRTSSAVPVVIFRWRMGTHRRWNLVRELWPSARAELTAIHTALGGADLSTFEDVLSDDRLRYDDHLDFHDDQGRGFAAKSAILRRLDPTAENHAYRDFVDHVHATRSIHLPPLDELGPWSASAAAALAHGHGAEELPVEQRIANARRLLALPAGLDLFNNSHSHLSFASGGLAVPHLVDAAQLLTSERDRVPVAWRSDPWWKTVEAIAQSPEYRGLEHLQFARELEQRGDANDAWTALMSAGFWAGVHGGDPATEVFEQALGLAHRAGWKDIATSLDAIANAPDCDW